ncbi:MAG: hypothetical protein A3B99_01055 [Candidatus Yanofskybacteria bacterium RIFCSPHIGHO2_02_FULL_44_12b]|uniref:Transposase IS200-like domain-containing protein n=2 Tax=Candidatus Yanofskyibacteriota TaxID=1752733 RepID=A0A1F8GL66_9BACT|nr:MAG: hypothetical protein A2659_02160 [Candidatus Yanofskybacteria bacterium RIFCSPHIGHO2_01_FULL_44_24]OGN15817.1 MAG: hypothetical protein A3B99_01055 [Candidatus Yanofskybacteria bacterium RIFCSPHIGHO2_02_FULL_44_12b]OGN26144.1 MAG: hypothetical protein A2925_05080 [Candidatus Yanofskybacteria bacterium RIFCSPLOWO2_01_FULL_44_22]
MNQPPFLNNQIYHIYNRGVEKRTIFMDDRDYFRFLHDLYEFNDSNPTPPSNIRLKTRTPSQCLEVSPPNIEKRRSRMVDILAFCLMPNHFHLLVRQGPDHGITRFMQKVGTGYTMYFNQRNERVGPLFQGKFKSILVQENRYLRHLYNYIHLNPLDLLAPSWRENQVKDTSRALSFLNNYRWSSYLDYIGNKNFPSILDKVLALEIFGNERSYSKNINEWLANMEKNYADFSSLTLE